MKHLAPEELVDAVDNALEPARRGHLDVCDQCRRQASDLRALMVDVRAVGLPEPSPLFWDRFAARVREAVEQEPTRPAARWFEWRVLAPLAGLAVLVAALTFAVVPSRSGGVVADEAASEPADRTAMSESQDANDAIEAQWALLAEIVGDLDVEAANEQGITTPVGAADAAVLQLSRGEQEELIRLLQQELKVGG